MKLKKQRPITEKPTFTTAEHYCTLFTSHLLNMQDVFFIFSRSPSLNYNHLTLKMITFVTDGFASHIHVLVDFYNFWKACLYCHYTHRYGLPVRINHTHLNSNNTDTSYICTFCIKSRC